MNLSLLDEVPLQGAENQVTKNAKTSLPPMDQARSALVFTHSITAVFNNWRSERAYTMNNPHECLKAQKRACDEGGKLSTKLALTQQNLNRATDQLDETKGKQYTAKRPRVTSDQN